MTVSELAGQIRIELTPLRSVFVKGEVSGVRASARGHVNFTIKDAGATLGAILFQDTLRRIGIPPEDGHEYLIRGRVDFWAQTGQLRLVVDQMQFDDLGRMRAELEELKRRLTAEGAFDPQRKRPIPFLPRCVALVTSPTGAVIHDLQETILDRFENMAIRVYPALVQGAGSPASVAAALRRCNLESVADVVVVARGGGSFEELYGFNSEVVVRAILGSAIPVVTALGHTSDRTLADLAADAECRTPTEAGARVVPRKADLWRALEERRRRLEREASGRLGRAASALEDRQRRLEVALPGLLRARQARLTAIAQELLRLSPGRQLERRAQGIEERRARLQATAQRMLRARSAEVSARAAGARLQSSLQGRLQQAQAALEQRRARLGGVSPERVLGRGYSISLDEAGRVLKSASQTSAGQRVRVLLAQGRLATRVEEVSDVR